MYYTYSSSPLPQTCMIELIEIDQEMNMYIYHDLWKMCNPRRVMLKSWNYVRYTE